MGTRYVRYTGQAHRRVITPQDWRSVRLSGDQVVWEAQNGHAVPLDVFTEEQIKRVINPDQDLIITDEDEDFEPFFSSMDMTPRELALSQDSPVDVLSVLDGTAGPIPSIPASRPGDIGTTQRADQPAGGSTLNRDDQD